MKMSKRTWTGEELQQHLDEWEARLGKGEKLAISLVSRPATFPLYPSMDNMLIFENEQIAALTDAQAKAVEFWLQRLYCQQHETPTHPRDTQFAGFAKLLYPELGYLFAALYSARLQNDERRVEQATQAIKTRIARRTYDLVKNGMKYIHDWMPDISDIPDITAWPKDGEE